MEDQELLDKYNPSMPLKLHSDARWKVMKKVLMRAGERDFFLVFLCVCYNVYLDAYKMFI